MTNKKNKNCIVVILLVISILLSSLNLVYTYKMQQNEYENYWWKENYEKVMMIQKAQIKAQFGKLTKEDVKKQIDSITEQQNPQEEDTALNTKKIPLSDIPKKEFVFWDESATITLFEHSDFNCPYCKRFHKSKVMEKLVEDYKWEVNYVFKNRPVIGWDNSRLKAKAAICAWNLSNKENYYKMTASLFEKPLNSKEDMFSEAEALGLDKEKYSTCLDSSELDTQITNTIEEWNKFGARGTPGTLVINNKTWEWTFVTGAVAYESFKTEIDKLLKK